MIRAAYLQPVLQLDDGAVEDGGGELPGDGDHLGGGLLSGRLDGLHLLLDDVVSGDPPSTLGEEALLLVQDELGLH